MMYWVLATGVCFTLFDRRGHLGEHADRGDVGRVPLEEFAQRAFRVRDAVFAQRRRRVDEPRIARRVADRFRVRGIRGLLHLERGVVIAERAPGVRQCRPVAHRAFQRRYCVLAPPHPPEREAGQRERIRLVGNDLEDLVRLFRRRPGIDIEEPRGIRQRDLECPGGLAGWGGGVHGRLRAERSLISSYHICTPS